MAEAKWYIVNAYSNFEKKVAESIKISAKEQGLSELIEEILIPTEEVASVKRGKKVIHERKFFPGYMLVKMVFNDDTYHLISSQPKVTGFLGGGKVPNPVSQAEIDKILNVIEKGVKTTVVGINYDLGSQVKVIDGPFATFTGVVEYIDEEHSRLKVAVSIFGRATPVELSYNQVEKI